MAKTNQDEIFFKEIQLDAKEAGKALNTFSASLSTLARVVTAIRGLDPVATSIKAIGENFKELGKLPEITRSLTGVNFEKFGQQMTLLATSLNPLKGFRTQATGLVNALGGIKAGVDGIHSTSFGGFKGQMEQLRDGLLPLNDIDKGAGALLNALSKVNEIVTDVNSLDAVGTGFDTFAESMRKFGAALEPVASLETKTGSLLAELRRLPDAVDGLNNINMEQFSTTLKGMAKTLGVLGTIKGGDFKGISNGIHRLIDAIVLYEEKIGKKGSSFQTAFPKLLQAMSGTGEVVNGDFSIVARSIERLINSLIILENIDNKGMDLAIKNLRRFIGALVESTEQLQAIDGTGFSKLVNAMAKLPDLMIWFNFLNPEDISKFASNVKLVIDALAPLEKVLASTVGGLKSLPKSLNGAIKASDRATRSFGRSTLSLGKMLGGMKRLLLNFGVYFSGRLIVNTLSKAYKISNDFIETLNLFAVALEDSTVAAMDTIEAWESVLGLDPEQAMKAWGEFSLLLQGFGDSSDSWVAMSNKMSQNLTQLSYDLSSLYNVDPSIAMTKLSSAMSGMARPLRQWGIDISNTAIQALALEMGIEKSVNAMTQAEKAQLRYILIMRKTSSMYIGAQGDLAKTITTPGNALRILRQQFTRLFRAIGDFVAPMMSKVLPDVLAFTRALVIVFETLAEFMAKALGYRKPEATDFLPPPDEYTPVMHDKDVVFDPYQDVVGFEAVEGAADQATDAVEETDEAISNLINGLDKFTTLSNKDVGGVGDYFLGLDDILIYEFDKIDEVLKEKIAGYVEALQPVVDAIKSIITVSIKLADNWKTVVEVFKIFIGLKIIWTLSSITLNVEKLARVAKLFSTSMATLSRAAPWMLLFVSLYAIVKIVKDLVDNWDDLTTAGKALRIALIGLIVALNVIIHLLPTAIQLMSFTAAPSVGTSGIVILSGALSVLGKRILAVSAALATKLWINLNITALYLKGLIIQIGTTLKAAIIAAATAVKTAFMTALAQLRAMLATVNLSLGMVIASVAILALGIVALSFGWDKMAGWERVVTILGAVAAAALTAAIAIGVFHTSWSMGIAAAAIAAGIALLLGSMGGVKKAMADTKVDAYASGGLPTKGSLFLANEKGPELVGSFGTRKAPNVVANNDMIVDAIKQASYLGMVEAINQTNGSGTEQKLVIDGSKINDNALARALFPALKLETKRRGGKL